MSTPFELVAAMPRHGKKPEAAKVEETHASPVLHQERPVVTAVSLSAKPAAAVATKHRSHVKPPINLDELEVMTGVNMGRRAMTTTPQWDQLFDVMLVNVGNAVRVPSIYHGGIAAAALKRRKAAIKAGTPADQVPLYKIRRDGIAKGVKGIVDGTPVSLVGRVS